MLGEIVHKYNDMSTQLLNHFGHFKGIIRI